MLGRQPLVVVGGNTDFMTLDVAWKDAVNALLRFSC